VTITLTDGDAAELLRTFYEAHPADIGVAMPSDHKRLTDLVRSYRRPVQVLAQQDVLFPDTWTDMAALVELDMEDSLAVLRTCTDEQIARGLGDSGASDDWDVEERVCELGRWTLIAHILSLPLKDL
jgi:hypothetical protein